MIQTRLSKQTWTIHRTLTLSCVPKMTSMFKTNSNFKNSLPSRMDLTILLLYPKLCNFKKCWNIKMGWMVSSKRLTMRKSSQDKLRRRWRAWTFSDKFYSIKIKVLKIIRNDQNKSRHKRIIYFYLKFAWNRKQIIL